MTSTEILVKIAKTTMPFGKYKGTPIIDLPQNYLLWFSKKGYPKGEIGMLLEITLEISINGQENLIKALKYE